MASCHGTDRSTHDTCVEGVSIHALKQALKAKNSSHSTIKSAAKEEDKGARNMPSGNTSLFVPQTSIVPQSGRSKRGRLRVALQPGRGIMDWVKLTSGKHIASKQLPFVDEIELSKHTRVEDCWVLLEDKVYDVTEYLSFHPGGVDELMRAAGCDGTDLFNKYHAWINQDTMLKACFVGYFKGHRNKLPEPKSSWVSDELEWPEAGDDENNAREGVVNELSKLNIRIIETSGGRVHLACERWADLKSENVCVDVMGNWVRVLVRPFGESTPLALKWSGIPKLLTSGMFTVSVESCTIKIHFNHSKDMAIFSSLDLISVEEEPELYYRRCTINKMHRVTHNINLYRVTLPSCCYFALPVGHHVNLRIDKKVVAFTRPFTPVLIEEDGKKISFLIKIYEDGKFSCALRGLKLGDTLEVSDPIGTIDFLSACRPHLCVLTAGTGITPMLRLLAARKRNPNTCASLLALNKTAEDSLEEETYEYCGLELAKDRVSLYHYESDDYDLNFLMISSFIDKEKPKILKEEEEDDGADGYRFLICGPKGFSDTALSLLTSDNPALASSVHVFEG